MSLTKEERQIVVNLELEKAKKTYEAMESCMHEKFWESAANRLYYAAFHLDVIIALGYNDNQKDNN